MASTAPKYNVIQDFGPNDGHNLAYTPYWIIAVIRLGTPLSFDRSAMASREGTVDQGALLRADKPLVITGDCRNVNVNNNKGSHIKSLSASLMNSTVNYLVEILPGDWVMCWMMYGKDQFDYVIDQIGDLKAVNSWKDGLKFVGRVQAIDKEVDVSPDGVKTSSYSLEATGFDELNTQFFYDMNLASRDVLDQKIGSWLARIGKSAEDLFASNARSGIQKNNVNYMIPTILDIIIGKGLAKTTGVDVAAGPKGQDGSETVNAVAGSGANKEAAYAYIIPTVVGKLLGREDDDDSNKVSLSYSHILELLQGVQSYPGNVDGTPGKFTPSLSTSKLNRRVCEKEMLGTFLPFFPDLANKPLWSVLQQYLNPAINELYTCLRISPEGQVMPTVVLRQIPFTTESFDINSQYIKDRQTAEYLGPNEDSEDAGPSTGGGRGTIPYTRFLELPRWIIPGAMIKKVRVGRSNATRTNFVHVYGNSLVSKSNISIQAQLVNNPPIRDDLDIQRSGLHAYMTQINCAVQDENGGTPGIWMALVADRMMGSQYTFNGTLNSFLVQAPICEGDNFEFDGVVYHIESVNHSCAIGSDGKRMARTNLTLSNGMRSDTDNDFVGQDEDFPIYPGFNTLDSTGYDPGKTADGSITTGDVSDKSGTTQAEKDRYKAAKAQDAENASNHEKASQGTDEDPLAGLKFI